MKDRSNYRKKRLWYAAFLVLLLCTAVLIRYFDGGLFPQEETQESPDTAALRLELSRSIADETPDQIPDYAGEDVVILNGGRPGFTEQDSQLLVGELLSPLDRLGRCGPAVALLDRSMMPEEERGEIGQIRPSGWKTARYPDLVEDVFLYNRCHLLAYSLTGENANPLNLITGTRHLNIDLMLPYEIQVADYLDHSDNHVLYRVTPLFEGEELVARGVEMEAYSVEDHGEGVSYHVFLYNVQPGIAIDYRTGDSRELANTGG